MIKTAVLAAVLAVALMFPAWHTMVATTDSVNYLSITDNLAHGRGPVNFIGKVELVHPFGYSLAMLPFCLAGMSSQRAAFMVNLFSLVAVGLVAFALLRDISGSGGWPVTVGALCVMANPALVTFSGAILSETLCAALALTFCWFCVKAGKDARWLAPALVCGSALCFTRYPGLAIVLGGGLFLRTWRDRAVVVLPSLLLMLGGVILEPMMRPFLTPHGTSLAMVSHIPFGVLEIITGPVALAALVYLIVKGRKLTATRILAGAVALYLLGLTALAIQSRMDPTLDIRLFVPISSVLLLLLIGLSMRNSRGFMPYLLTALVLAEGYGAVQNAQTQTNSAIKQLNAPCYSQSPFMRLIRTLPDSVTVYSTSPSAVYLHTGRVTRAIPNTLDRVYADNQTANSPIDAPARTGGLMVWLARSDPRYAAPSAFVSIAVGDSAMTDTIAGYQELAMWVRRAPCSR